MNGNQIVIAIVSVGIGLGGLILNGQHTTNGAIADLREDFGDLSERMAPLEGLFEGHLEGDCRKAEAGKAPGDHATAP